MGIRGVNKVVVSVRDRDRAKSFWCDTLGFTCKVDEAYGEGQRWIEITTPDGNAELVLSADRVNQPIADRDEIPNSNPFFYTDDVEQTYAELSAKGVEFPVKPSKQFWGWWSMFTDTEGNRFALGQRD